MTKNDIVRRVVCSIEWRNLINLTYDSEDTEFWVNSLRSEYYYKKLKSLSGMSAKSARSKVSHLSFVGRIKQRLSWLEHAGK